MASTHSRNSIRRAVAVLVVLLIGIGGSGYTHVNDKNGRKLKTEGAQVYANDDQSSGVVYTLEPGDEYQLLDVDEQWCRIRVEKDDVEGYALVIELDLDVDEILAALNETEDEAETVEAVIETAAEPTVEPTEEPTAEPTEEPIEEATEAPAGDATQAPEDTATEEPTEDATEQPTAEPTADATEAPAEPDEGDEIEREYDATHTPAPEKRVGAVDADELNVYAQADESSDVVITLERDDEVEILGEEGAFLLVSADEQQGYALAECIYELSHDEQAALKTMWGTAVVTASSLNVRKTGSTSASLLYKIKSGQRVMLRGVDGDWYCIETESGKGYVLGDHLTVNAITGTSYKQGAKGDDVKELQRRLIELKYLTGTADGSFGASTKTAVAAFQRKAGLDADGIAGPTTLAVLYDADAPSATPTDDTLEQGDSGDAVKALQKRLIELGYMNGTADGDFGSATKAAVKLFQKQAGLTVDGVAGPGTQGALFSSNAPKYDGKTSVDTDTSSTAAKIIATAKQYMGCTYVYGTSGPNTFDCSGFTCFVFKKYGYSLLRSAQQQGYDDNYERLTRSELKMGDIVCFNTISDNDLSDHVGIYISDGNFIHASSGGGCVMISNLDSGYYNRVFSWGRRILD